MYYYAQFEKEENGYTVTFRDIPEAITCGETYSNAQTMAEDVLISSVDIYFEDNRPFPLPSKELKNETAVFMPEVVFAKVLLHNTMLEQGIKKADLARLINTNPPEVQRILNPYHRTKIDTISKALRAMGKTLTLTLS